MSTHDEAVIETLQDIAKSLRNINQHLACMTFAINKAQAADELERKEHEARIADRMLGPPDPDQLIGDQPDETLPSV
jgi:hypothetical protein